jgi:hypothetical protein
LGLCSLNHAELEIFFSKKARTIELRFICNIMPNQ